MNTPDLLQLTPLSTEATFLLSTSHRIFTINPPDVNQSLQTGFCPLHQNLFLSICFYLVSFNSASPTPFWTVTGPYSSLVQRHHLLKVEVHVTSDKASLLPPIPHLRMPYATVILPSYTPYFIVQVVNDDKSKAQSSRTLCSVHTTPSLFPSLHDKQQCLLHTTNWYLFRRVAWHKSTDISVSCYLRHLGYQTACRHQAPLKRR